MRNSRRRKNPREEPRLSLQLALRIVESLLLYNSVYYDDLPSFFFFFPRMRIVLWTSSVCNTPEPLNCRVISILSISKSPEVELRTDLLFLRHSCTNRNQMFFGNVNQFLKMYESINK